MKAYAIKTEFGFLDLAVRANSETDALAASDDFKGGTAHEIASKVAEAMEIPEDTGIHKGVLSRWLYGSTTLTGNFRSN